MASGVPTLTLPTSQRDNDTQDRDINSRQTEFGVRVCVIEETNKDDSTVGKSEHTLKLETYSDRFSGVKKTVKEQKISENSRDSGGKMHNSEVV